MTHDRDNQGLAAASDDTTTVVPEAETGLHVGLALPTQGPGADLPGPRELADAAMFAERAGFDSVWVGDHLQHSWAYHECLVTLGFIAACTQRVKIGSCMLQLPLRQLAVAAKQIASLGVLSKGRFILGAAVGGDLPGEWAAAGVPRSERGIRMDEAVPLLRRLLAGETVAAECKFTTLPGYGLRPVPPPVPLLFGGGVAGMRRAASDGDGWIGTKLSIDEFATCHTELMDLLARFGRSRNDCPAGMLMMVHVDERDDDADLRAAHVFLDQIRPDAPDALVEKVRPYILAGTPAGIAERAERWRNAGCSTLVMTPAEQGQARDGQVRILAEEVLPLLR